MSATGTRPVSRGAARGVSRWAVVTGLVAGLTVGMAALAGPAAAHVTANPVGEAAPGSYARVDFRAPTESDTAATTGLEVRFPEDNPIPSVSTGPVPGWDVEVDHRTLDEPIEGGHGEVIEEVVASITWTAVDDDAAVGPGQFGEFPVSMGPLPEADALLFPTLQTYSDDTVVRWIDVAEEGVDVDNPAPALEMTPAAAPGSEPTEDGAQAGDPAGDPAGEDDTAGSATDIDATGTPGWLIGVAVAGLAAALAALALGAVALTRTRS